MAWEGRNLFGERAAAPKSRGTLIRWVSWFWFFIATISLLIGTRYVAVAGAPEELTASVFLATLTLGHWYSLYFLLAVLVFYPLALLLPYHRLLTFMAGMLAVLCLVLLVIDVFSFGLFRFHLNGLVFSLLFSGAADEIFVFSWDVYLISVVLFLLIIAVVAGAAKLAWSMVNRQTWKKLGWVLGLVLALSFVIENIWFSWANAAGVTTITSQARFYPVYIPTRADSFYYDNGLAEPGQNQAITTASTTGLVNYPRSPLQCGAEGRLPNIFFIVIDSWRKDALSAEVTPNIDNFSREAMAFNRHYAGGNNTRTGLFSLFYGLPATYWESFLDARKGAVFVEQLQQHGYDLAIYASAKLTGPEFDRTIFAEVPDLRKATAADSVYARDELATQEFVAHLARGARQPVFGFLFYDAPHSYAVAKRYKGHFQPSAERMNYYSLTKDSDPEPIVNLYRNAVISDDHLVGQALEAIKQAGLWDNSIIVITGDHAQEFNDNGLGYWGHNGNFTDAQLHVPLLVKWPGKAAQAIGHTTTHFDITTTLMQEVFRCDNPASDYSVGTSLFSSDKRFGFVVGGFGDFAIRLAERIYWVDKYGGVHVLSDTNRELAESPEPAVISSGMQQISRFLQ